MKTFEYHLIELDEQEMIDNNAGTWLSFIIGALEASMVYFATSDAQTYATVLGH